MERAMFFTHEFDVEIMKQNIEGAIRKYPIIVEQKNGKEIPLIKIGSNGWVKITL